MQAETDNATWRELLDAGGPRQRLLDGHPLHLYFGADAASKPVFFLITTEKPQVPQMSAVVTVERRERTDGSYAVVLTLQDLSYSDAFMGMCMELARRSGESNDAQQALGTFFETLQQWKTLLSHGLTKRLSKEQIRGLVAELWFGLDYLAAQFSPGEVLKSWQGPYGAPQDYRTPDGCLYEIKSVHGGSRSVDISSVDQLDPMDRVPLVLCVVTVEEIELQTSGGVSLVDLVAHFRAELSATPKLVDELNDRFHALAFDPSDGIYADQFFLVGGLRRFDVSGSFPRLLRGHVPLGIETVRYKLKLAAISDFEIRAQTTAFEAR